MKVGSCVFLIATETTLNACATRYRFFLTILIVPPLDTQSMETNYYITNHLLMITWLVLTHRPLLLLLLSLAFLPAHPICPPSQVMKLAHWLLITIAYNLMVAPYQFTDSQLLLLLYSLWLVAAPLSTRHPWVERSRTICLHLLFTITKPAMLLYSTVYDC